jgi:hypothetical protein
VTDVVVVSLGSTGGWRARTPSSRLRSSGRERQRSWRRRSARRDVRTYALTDLVWARAARAAAQPRSTSTRRARSCTPRPTAALLWPRPGAIRFDTLARDSRPGRHGFWQRPLERRRLARRSC